MRVSQTGRGNLPQILHATGPCPSAFGVVFPANSVACILRNQGPMSTRLSQPRALGWEVLSDVRKHESEEICLKFCTQPALAPVHSPCLFHLGILRNQGPMRALRGLSGLMSGNDYEGFPNGRGKCTMPQCIRRCFFSKFCCMHFGNQGPMRGDGRFCQA